MPFAVYEITAVQRFESEREALDSARHSAHTAERECTFVVAQEIVFFHVQRTFIISHEDHRE